MKLFKNKRTLSFILIALVLIGIILTIITPSLLRPTFKPIIPTPTSPISAIPTLPLEPVNPTQKLIINWHEASIAPPQQLPTYQITSPLINSATIQTISKSLNFTDSDAKETLQPENKLYVKGSLSLFASTKQNQIQFTNSAPLPNKTGFTSVNQVNQKIKNYLQTFFPDQSFDLVNQEHFFATDNEIYPQKTTLSRANLTRVNYRQTLNNLPLITTASSNAIISFLIDNNQILRSLEISTGYSQVSQTSSVKITDFQTLIQLAPQTALPFSVDAIVDVTSLIQSQSVVTLDVDDINLVYLTLPENNQITPVFLLEGKLSTTGATNVSAHYIVPASY